MEPETRLPALAVGDAAWRDAPPDPLDDPDLYDGLIWRRMVAYLVDALAILAIMGGLFLVLTIVTVLSFGLLFPLKIVVLALVPLAYHSYFVGHDGATPGMRLFDVEIRVWTGRRPDYVQAFLVALLFYATVLPTSWLVLVVALFNERNRTLHDLLTGTLAVRRSRHPDLGAQAA